MGAESLVKQLRELDARGAPFLLQAATRDGNPTCFSKTVKIICEITGVGAVNEQANAVDFDGRNILMYAARTCDPALYMYALEVFERICELMGTSKESPNEFIQDRHGQTVVHDAAEENLWTLPKTLRTSSSRISTGKQSCIIQQKKGASKC